jgi:prophage pi3 protein 38-like sequence
MSNFIEETIEAIGERKVKEFKLEFYSLDWGDDGDDNDVRTRADAQGTGKEALMSFFSTLPERAIDYDSGYGTQEWSGWISFQDGTWLERAEYDGSEWWSYKSCPKLS